MIRTITADNAENNTALLNEMFRARKDLFLDRLNWDVSIDDQGREIDRFDALSPVYVIDVDGRERHRGSVRLLPTTGDTVLRDRIADMFDGVPVKGPSIWEYTRFCVTGRERTSPASRHVEQVTINLMLGICEACIAARVDHVVGSFDRHMNPIFVRHGWMPDLLGRSGQGRDAVYLGLWETTAASADALRAAGGKLDSTFLP